MPPIPSRMSAPTLDLDRGMAARRSGGSGSGSPAGAPPPRRRRSGISGRRVFLVLVVLAALAFAGWRYFRPASGLGARPAAGLAPWIDLSRVDPELRPVAEYLLPSPDEAKIWFDTVRTSSYVRQKWADRASAVEFSFRPEENLVNAFAAFADGDPGRPAVVLCGGFVRLARLIGAFQIIGAAAAARGEEADAEAYFRRVSQVVLRKEGSVSFEDVVGVLDEFRVPPEAFQVVSAVTSAKALSDGVCKAALAHEMGHIAAGHPAGADPNQTVSRNEEAQADLFASSVAASVANGDQMLLGQILQWYVLALGEEADPGAEIFRSHPFSADRLRAAVDANRELAASLGIESGDVDALIGNRKPSARE